MKSIFSKAAMIAVIGSFLAINVQAATSTGLSADTGKMSKMSKMDSKMAKSDKMDSKMAKTGKMDSKMTKKQPAKAKKGKMAKDTSKM